MHSFGPSCVSVSVLIMSCLIRFYFQAVLHYMLFAVWAVLIFAVLFHFVNEF